MFGQGDSNLLLALLIAGFCLLGTILLIVIPLLPEKVLNGLVFGVFLLSWTSVTLVFDSQMVRCMAEQLRARDYPAVEGEVLKCKVKEPSGGGDRHTDLDVEYVYEVENQRYTCTQVRFGRKSGTRWISAFVAAHPASSRITVYYDPDDPAHALLLRGVGGDDLLMALFSVPFNTFMIVLWCAAFALLFLGKKSRLRLLYGFRIVETKGEVRVRLPVCSTGAAALVMLFLEAIISFFVVALGFGLSPSIAVMVITWGRLVGMTGVVCLILAMRARSGQADLVIKLAKQRLILPQTFGRKEPVVVPLTDVRAIEVVKIQDKNHKDQWPLIVRWCDRRGRVKEATLAQWNQGDAEWLASWLRSRTGLVSVPLHEEVLRR